MTDARRSDRPQRRLRTSGLRPRALSPGRWAVVGAVFGVALGGIGCSDESSGTVRVELTTSTQPNLDPFAPDVGLEVIQVVVDGPDRGDDATISLAPGERTATFSGFPLGDADGGPLTVRAEGLDAQGNIVAFGRIQTEASGDDLSVQFPLRRNLAYVIHRRNQNQANPEGVVYVIDPPTRSLVERIDIEGADPRADWITARGGDSLLVTYRDGGIGYLGVLSAQDHTWRRIELDAPQRVALGVEGQSLGVVAGGGFVSFVDLDEGRVVSRTPPPGQEIGGTVIDGVIAGDGRTALFILGGVELGFGTIIFVNIEAQSIQALDVVSDPAGVALSSDGRVAFVTSGSQAAVAEVDLRNGLFALANGFDGRVGLAAFSENMQAVLALDADPSARRVLALLPRANCPTNLQQNCGEPIPAREATPTTEVPVDISADGVGRQIIVVGAGTSTAGAGLTLIETFEAFQQLPIGTRTTYPGDPEDTFVEGRNLVRRQRYQPRAVTFIYGR